MRKAVSIFVMNLTWIYVAGGEPSMAASLGSAASASSECLYQLSYLHPDGFLVPGSAWHTQSVSGPNLADGGCPSSHSVADPNGWPQQSSSLTGGGDSEAQGTASYGALQGSTRSASSLGGWRRDWPPIPVPSTTCSPSPARMALPGSRGHFQAKVCDGRPVASPKPAPICRWTT